LNPRRNKLSTHRVLPVLIFLTFSVERSLAQKSSSLLITGASVLSADGTKFIADHDVHVVGDRIAAVGTAGSIVVDAEVERLNCSGLYLLPGLIDLHTHFLLHPYNEAKWDDQVLRESLESRTIRGVVSARHTLEAGFTTVRDLGTEGAGFADVALRNAIRDGLILGPRMFAVTRAIVATGCYGPDGFDPRWDVPKGAQEATGPVEVRKAVRQQIAAGADWIKVYADYRRTPGKEATPTFSQEELDSLVDEARSAGLPTVAHATVDEGIRRAVLAGVATIEHGYEGSTEVFTLMKERGVVLCPTLAASEAMIRYAQSEPGAQATGGLPSVEDKRVRLRETFQRALKSGVTIACGSDAGVFSHGDNARELELMVEFGMTPQQAILAATATAAKVLHREGDLGKLDAGYLADLIAVRQNPLEHITALRHPALVIKCGAVAIDHHQSEPQP
jgi:imidazolonepropionase-like amidohydrolase